MIDLETTERRYLRIDEVMELFGVSRRTIYNWVRRDEIKYKVIDKSTRIEVEDLRRRLHAVRSRINDPEIIAAILRDSRKHCTASALTP